jgi:glycopeptide antibiotics resistance protein
LILLDFIPGPSLVGGLILLVLLVRGRKRGWRYLSGLGLFGIYLMAVIDLAVFPIIIPQAWPAFSSWSQFLASLAANSNLVPFNYGNLFAQISEGAISLNVALWEIGGNLLLGVPFGLGICLFHPMPGKRIFWVALGAGLALESAQLLIFVVIGPSMHSIDINDVLLNGLGVLTGYGIFLGIRSMWQRFGSPTRS